ncbi:uclacyanin 1-like [Zingiber officinale]|uniref:Phytocyanin domain-containing protein n=1 Tax=Zingiber officinale TaxID=94328 RepID=A0A8J5GSH7_ZINOF|nr:uclacyanin 1-like [Zingiber officinale]KAG6509175.1 hypothetical protein ZIOFF_034566 [Zingiber officinale]
MAGSSWVYLGLLVSLTALASTDNAFGTTVSVQHVVGNDQGLDLSSNLAAWSINRILQVGDEIWFAYSATTEDSIMELQSKQEFESCNLSNPIKLYSKGFDKVRLHGEGARYFSSGKLEECEKGLKLHVEVMPKVKPGGSISLKKVTDIDGETAALAPGTSGSSHAKASLLVLFVLAIIFWC